MLLLGPRSWLISFGLEEDEPCGEPWRSADVLGRESWLVLDLVASRAGSGDWRGT